MPHFRISAIVFRNTGTRYMVCMGCNDKSSNVFYNFTVFYINTESILPSDKPWIVSMVFLVVLKLYAGYNNADRSYYAFDVKWRAFKDPHNNLAAQQWYRVVNSRYHTCSRSSFSLMAVNTASNNSLSPPAAACDANDRPQEPVANNSIAFTWIPGWSMTYNEDIFG